MGHNGNLRKVLLVDDDPVQLRIREAVLRGAGLQAVVATNAEAAIAMLQAAPDHGIGVVLTDHIMPGLSGTEFVRRVRRMIPEMPVVVISGLPEAETQYDGLAVTFRQKPCPPPELISVVKRSLEDLA